jgi:predicted nucleic acid-binding protein
VEAVAAFREKVRSAVNEILTEHHETQFSVSRLSLLECLVKPVRERNAPIIERYRSFFTSRDLSIVEIGPEVIDCALLLQAGTGLRTPDAIQAASALTLPDPPVFVTGDRAFSKVPDLNCRIIR